MDDLSKLILQAQSRDKEAFGKIYSLFWGRIFRYLKFNTQDEETAKDLCQETFLKAWRAISTFSFKKGGSFQAFLFRIAKNNLIDFGRKRKELPLDPFYDVESEQDLDVEIERRVLKEEVQAALLRLDKLEKDLVILRYFEDLTTKEVAEVLKMSDGAVRVRITRILKKLKVYLELESQL